MRTETIGSRIREQRTALGLSQLALASRAGVTQGLIAQIERGDNKGSKHIVAISRALGVSAEWLADGTGAPPGPPSGRDFRTRENQQLLDAWQNANPEAREVARYVLSGQDASQPDWVTTEYRHVVGSMLYAAMCWLRREPGRDKKSRAA